MFKKLIILVIYAVFFSFARASAARAEDITFSKNDKVLILAPHPDDEAIATGGVIQRALKAGANVKVVCFTNGDNNELSFIVYEKRLTFKKREFLHMGEVRAKETRDAMGFLGLDGANIIFLGYPDFGTMRILTEYWGGTKPYQSWLTRVNKVSYPDAMSINAPYVGDSVLKDLEEIILSFKPTKVFVSHPADVNRDHRAMYVYLQVALLDLAGKISLPSVYPYLVHAIRWPMPRGYNPELELDPPEKFKESGIFWQKLMLTEDEIKAKYDAINLYKSQIPYAPSYLVTFVRKNELFGDFPSVKLIDQSPLREITWQELDSPEELNEDEEAAGQVGNEEKKHYITNFAFARQGEYLLVKVNLLKNIEQSFGVSLFLFGYKKGVAFGQMPKIQIPINLLGIHLKDKKKTLSVKKIKYIKEGKILTLKIPLSLLGGPDHIFSYIRAQNRALPVETTAWRILEF